MAEIGEFLSVHTKDYLEGILALSEKRNPDVAPAYSPECRNLYDFIPGYKYGLGGMKASVDLIKEGAIDRAWCWTLPGHHVYPGRGHGYCLLNTQAAAVRYAQKNGFRQALIVDWDFHHGDGTQTIFANDPSVYQISVYCAVDLYMSLMRVTRLGSADYGKQVCHRNIPVMDRDYGAAFYRELGEDFTGALFTAENCVAEFRSALESLPFEPDLVFIFDGHDAHREDLGRTVQCWRDKDFAALTKLVLDAAERWGCPVISSPGGDYRRETARRLTEQHLDLLGNYRPGRRSASMFTASLPYSSPGPSSSSSPESRKASSSLIQRTL